MNSISYRVKLVKNMCLLKFIAEIVAFVKGSSNLSVLTETGAKQAEKCRDALANMKFGVFSSPISRAKVDQLYFMLTLNPKPTVYLNAELIRK